MRIFYTLFLICVTSFAATQKHLVVCMPCYNTAEWCTTTLDSIFDQNYENYLVKITVDASTDNSFQLMQEHIATRGMTDKVELVCNETRVGSLANKYRMIHECADHDIVIDLDGDDWFAHDEVFAHINQAFDDPHMWFMYSQFEYWPSGRRGWNKALPPNVKQRNWFRMFESRVVALRCFYAGLFKKIKKQDLQWHGDFFQITGDEAFIFPLLELSGMHTHFVDEIMYIYNYDNPLNDHKKNPTAQQMTGKEIRRRTPYKHLADSVGRAWVKTSKQRSW